ncbi:MAG TPA: helix-turn-helix transcriptional regulator [Candidatus Nanoarchaeia archaeon]|nr:helix-turn-helix transcriptional regulator [Candidatus Nanoarchaeia archaeon]
MAGEQNPIEEARTYIVQGHRKLIDAYCDEIKKLYESSNKTKQEKIEKNLESLLKSDIALNSPFEPEVAKRIRLGAGLSLIELVREIGFKKISVATVSRIERGMCLLSEEIPTKGPARSYLHWIKEKGYNPYNLK